MKPDLFENLAFETHTLSTGEALRLPLRYEEWSFMCVGFLAPASAVRRWMPTPRLKPVLSFPGYTMVCISAFEYRKPLDLAPYNELAVTVAVQYDPPLNFPGLPLFFDPLLSPARYHRGGVWIQRLPVTTQQACTWGVDLWGFPKTVAEIAFEDGAAERTCRMRSGGREVLAFSVSKLPTRYEHINYHVYTVKGGELLRTPLCWDGEWGVSQRPGGASLTLGEGAIADELRALDMGKTPYYRIYAPRCQSLLPGPGERIPL